MKKFLLYASAVAAMMLAGSCQKEVFNPVSKGEASVKLSIALPEGLQTKAMSQAESTNIVYYEIWNSDWTRQLYPVEEAGVQSAYASTSVDNCTATIDLKLISDQTYNFIFWAQNEACGAYDVTQLKNVGVNYDVIAANGNQDKYDAFYAVKTITVTGPINQTVTLYRPFAQLNFGADEMTTTFGDIVVTATEIKVSELATVFNTIDGVGEQATSVAVPFTATGLATTDEDLVAGGKAYTWVTMDYMLMMNTEALVNVEASFGVDGMDLPVKHSITNVPLKKNYRTNIVGDLFTTDAKLNIIVDPDFNKPDLTPIMTIEGLQAALDNAPMGTTTILIGNDLVGDVIVKQTEGKNIIINGLDHSYDGTIYIWGNARYDGAETLAIQNVNFKHAEGAIDFISSNTTASAERYAHNVTIEGCTFEGGVDAVAAKFRQAYNITIKDSQVIAGHSLAQLTGCAGVAIEGVDVKAGRGVSFGTSTACTVSNSTFEVESYGLRADGSSESEGSLSVSGTTIEANQPVIVRKMTGKYAVTLENPVLNTTASYQVVFTNGADDAAYVVPTGVYSLTGAEGINVFPVADADSFAAAVANDALAVVELEGKVTSEGVGFEVNRDVVLNMNGYEFNAGSNASSTWYALEVNGEHNVEINDANLTRAGIFAGNGADVVFNSGVINHKPERTSRYIFCAKSGSTITIKDGTFKNDRAKNSFFWADGDAVIYVEGGNFAGVASNNKVVTSNGGQVIITGGKFNFDPTAWVADGYTATKSGSTWTVSQN